MNLDTRIEASLKAAVDAEPSNTPLPLADVKETALGRRRRERIVAWTVSGIALLAVVFTLTIQTGIDPSDVAEDDVSLSDGEVLLSTDPVVVVQGAASPEPQFDTSSLGVEQPLTPLTDIERIEAAVDLHTGFAVDPEVLRVTTVGTTVGGQDTVILHLYETDRFSGRRLQLRCTLPSGGCFGESLDDPSIDPEQLLQPDPRNEPSHEVGGPGHITWDAPPGTSVVVLTVNGDPVWQRPISGVAVFDAQLLDGDRFEIQALDENGVALAGHTFTAENSPSNIVDGYVDGQCLPTITEYEFTPPDPYRPSRRAEGMVWYGTSELWTVLDAEGDHSPRKSVWWSKNFPGGGVEEQPEISVTWVRLDAEEEVITETRGTNAWTADDGSFMIGGIDPDAPGCWEVTATYKGASLSYVYERP